MNNVITKLDGTLQYIEVNDLSEHTFYARLAVERHGDLVMIDSRPSDAIALAVRASVPIYAEEAVLAKAGIVLDEDTGKPLAEGKVDEQEIEGLSAFKDFISTLDLEDFNKRKS